MKTRVPHVYALLFFVIIGAAILTYIVPAGEYDRFVDEATGRTLVDPDSFTFVESQPVGLMAIFESVQRGMIAAGNIVFFIFIIGGAFGIIAATGAIDAGLGLAVRKLANFDTLLLIAIVVLFSIGGATFGMAEETLVFIPIGVMLAKQLGYDAMVGLAIVTLGARVGFGAGVLNPFNVGVAQEISELPLFSGLEFRLIWYVIFLAVTIAFILRYARKIKANPELSVLSDWQDDDASTDTADPVIPAFTRTHGLVLLTIALGFGIVIYGVFSLGWYITELAGMFLAMGIVAGVVGRLGVNGTAKSFVVGARELTFGALIVGLARGILVVLEQGLIIDTIIYAGGTWLSGMPAVLAANGMLVFQTLLNVLIPSGSGQAAATMPIMAPISDLAGITRQTAVLAFHYGDTITNLISPTVGTLMASLAIAKVPFARYAKWVFPLVLIWLVVGMAAVTTAVMIGYGPF
ncbi:MAG: putative basic amino acid antiporter YfcC [Spirochaetaceae bacterium]|nr:MAG: putative basic amino acid antiporter YfcC [Spirochaetaceae bacterium]